MSWLVTTDIPVSLDLQQLTNRLERALARSTRPHADIALRFVSHAESAQLNIRYRRKDTPANVLSFPAEGVPKGEHLVGDVVIAYPILRKGFPAHMPDDDIALSLAVHGLLHLLGYDHERDDDAAAMDAANDSLLA